jgi:hypothetical protein
MIKIKVFIYNKTKDVSPITKYKLQLKYILTVYKTILQITKAIIHNKVTINIIVSRRKISKLNSNIEDEINLNQLNIIYLIAT